MLYNRWLFGGRQLGGKAMWFWAHLGMQVFGFALFAAGFIVAMVSLPRPPDRDSLHFSHAVMG